VGGAGLVSTTELDEVQTLLERVLPDPSGYAQRLLQQAVTRWGQGAGSPATTFYTTYATASVDDDGDGGPEPSAGDDPLTDTNLLLAAALGACECWGLRASCDLCEGHGTAGWTEPDPALFDELVMPAVIRLSAAADGDLGQRGEEPPARRRVNRHKEKAT
jgi:hypothetical protein